MAEPNLQNVHIDQALSNISIAYRNMDYICKDIFPEVTVEFQSDKYYIWDKDSWFRNYVELRAPNSAYPEAGLQLSQDAYFCDIYHLAFPIADEIQKNADAAIKLENTGAEWLADQFELNMELKWVADFFKKGVWGTDQTLNGATQWSDYVNSNPILAVDGIKQSMRKKSGHEPNKMVMGREVYDKLKEHPKLIEKYENVERSVLNKEQIDNALGIETLVGSAIQNTSAEGQTFTGSFIWGKKVLFVYVPPSPGLNTASAGYTFVWSSIGGLKVTIERERKNLHDAEVLKGKNAWGQKAVATDLGHFLDTVIA